MELLDKYDEDGRTDHRPIATVGDSSTSRKKPQKETDAAKLARKIKICAHNNPCRCKKPGGDCTWGRPIRLHDDLKTPVARTAADSPPGRTGPPDKVTQVPSDDNLTRPQYGAYETGRGKFLLYPKACAARGSKGKGWGKGWAKRPPNACGRDRDPFCKPCHCEDRTREYNEADRKRIRDEAAGGVAAAGSYRGGKRARLEDDSDLDKFVTST